MLVRIGSKRSGDDAPRGIVPRLEDCHGRIRRFTAIADKLATVVVDGVPDEELRQAAAGCVSYFDRALPHHSADEDESIAPHIHTDPRVADAVASMTAQHVAIHAVLDQLIPLWKRVETEPAALAELQPALAPLTRDLAAKFDEHLALEEQTIFPVIAALPDDLQTAIVDEMIARRLP